MRKFGFLDRAVAYLEEAGMEVKVIAYNAKVESAKKRYAVIAGPDFY